jgi:hypothetical protein
LTRASISSRRIVTKQVLRRRWIAGPSPARLAPAAEFTARDIMRLTLCCAAAIAGLIAAMAMLSPPAEAAAKKRVVGKTTRVAVVGRPRARITVRQRSFLDPGTEVLPGSERSTDYAIPPGYSPTAIIENRAGVHRWPLPGPFDLPGRNNPFPWNW